MTASVTAKSIHELRRADGPLFIRNNSDKLVTIRQDFHDVKVNIELPPHTTDILPSPRALEIRGVQMLLMSGQLTISTDEDMQNEITLQVGEANRVGADRVGALLGEGKELTVESSITNRTLTEKACAECGEYNPKTGALVRGRVLQSTGDVKNGVVPLCELHKHLVGQFIAHPREDGSFEFKKVQIG